MFTRPIVLAKDVVLRVDVDKGVKLLAAVIVFRDENAMAHVAADPEPLFTTSQ